MAEFLGASLEPDEDDLATSLDLIWAIENCTEVFGNLSLAEENNVTCLRHAPVLTNTAEMRVWILAFMCIFSIFGNVLTVVAIYRDKHRTSLCTLILHLSIADCLVGFFCLGGEAIWTYTVSWNYGNILCKLLKFFQMLGLYASTFMVVVVGVDRWQAITHPLQRSQAGKRRFHSYIATAWSISIFLSLPQLLIFRVSKGPFIEEFYQCVTYGFYTARWQEQLYSIFNLVCNFIIPLVILILTCSSTLVRLKDNERGFHQPSAPPRSRAATASSYLTQAEQTRQKKMRRATRRSLQLSLYIVGAFLICWIPYYVVSMIIIFSPSPEKVPAMLLDGIFCFGMFNSLLNPIIYGAFHLWKPSTSHSNGVTELKSVRRKFSSKSSFLCQSSGTPNVMAGRPSASNRNAFNSPPNQGPTRNNGLRKQPVQRCNTTESGPSVLNQVDGRLHAVKYVPNPAQNAERGTFMLSRCATFDVPTSKVDRKKVSMKRRQIKEQLYKEDTQKTQGPNGGHLGNGGNDYAYDYTQDILGENEEILNCTHGD
eukprot:snap_masked-scaffold229_size244821-processed-gene-1.3 protein:Tk01410 transcript:snap_masked-scaffold229_size244821-processed-gene-1.3-mRNA-1 annotation:"neuropeptide receptor a21"